MAVGDIIDFKGQAISVEVRVCDGTCVRRDEFPDLFAVIGTQYGFSSDEDFMLPAMPHESWEFGHFYCIEVDSP